MYSVTDNKNLASYWSVLQLTENIKLSFVAQYVIQSLHLSLVTAIAIFEIKTFYACFGKQTNINTSIIDKHSSRLFK